MVALRRTRLKAHHEPRLSGMCGVLTDMMTADGPGNTWGRLDLATHDLHPGVAF